MSRSRGYRSGLYTVRKCRPASENSGCTRLAYHRKSRRRIPPPMQLLQRGSIIGSILGIVVCGGLGGITAWSVVTLMGWNGAFASDRGGDHRHGRRDGRMGSVDFAAAHVRPRAMSTRHDIAAIATRLIRAYDTATQIAPITDADPTFDVAAAYDVLREIENRRRIAQGWHTVGRKIGFTNTTIWSRYGVYQPMWAHIWSHSTHFAKDGHATLDLEAVRAAAHRARGRVPAPTRRCRPRTIRSRSCVASNGSRPDSRSCNRISRTGNSRLPTARRPSASMARSWSARRSRSPIATGVAGRGAVDVQADAAQGTRDRSIAGVGANVLGSPTLALAHLVRVLAAQPQFARPVAGRDRDHRDDHRRVAGRSRARRGRATTARSGSAA